MKQRIKTDFTDFIWRLRQFFVILRSQFIETVMHNEEKGVLRSLDYVTIVIYMLLLVGGWISVCGASYTYGEPSEIFSLASRSGMQIVWIGTSLVLALVLLLLDDRLYDTFAFALYGFLILLLFATIFNPHSIKGSHSWLVLGPLRIQPAEFAKSSKMRKP